MNINDWTKKIDPLEEKSLKTKEMMIRDILLSIELDRAKMRENPELEPFTFEDLVNSAQRTIWLPKFELREICVEALFRCLDPRDYRKHNKKEFEMSIKL